MPDTCFAAEHLPLILLPAAEEELQAAVEALRKQYTEVGDRLEQEQGLVLQLRWAIVLSVALVFLFWGF